MKIKKVTWRMDNDFYADYECEHCNTVYNSHGYEDSHFHKNVIPALQCHDCGKSSNDKKLDEVQP